MNPEKKNKRNEVVLAALMHDIGKFAQRAKAPKASENEGEFCPSYNGRPSHLHVLYSYEFLSKLFNTPKGINRDLVAAMASRHHRPFDTLEDMSISIGDRLSSGIDRQKQQNEEDGNYIKDRLISIFEEISLDSTNNSNGEEQKYKFATIDENPYPSANVKGDRKEYKSYWDQFLADVKHLDADLEFPIYLSALLSLLEKYLWCIPSATYKTVPDISLYDHSYLSASITQAMYTFHEDEDSIPENNEKDRKQKKMILFGGDLSGIQNYIFDTNKEQSTGLAKLFRARSFYLQMLTKTLILDLLDKLDLLSVAQIMDAGGKFILLLPNTKKVKKELDQFELDAQRWFMEKFKGILSFNCSREQEVSYNDLLLGTFEKTLNDFFDSLEARKTQKFHRVIREKEFNPVLPLDFQSDFDNYCTICNRNPADRSQTEQFKKKHGSNLHICSSCFDQIEILGTELPKSENRYFVLGKGDSPGKQTSVRLYRDWMIYFLDEKPEKSHMKYVSLVCNMYEHGKYGFHPIAGHLPTITKEDLEFWELTGQKAEMEKHKNDKAERLDIDTPKTFHQIARMALRKIDNEKKAYGKAYLGVLKADVDNLGFVFSIGLRDKLSISRFASLSRMLNHFFSVELIKMINTNLEFKDIYVVFSGGDDLFLIGPWTKVFKFAAHLREKFSEYTAGNPELTFSAGILVEKSQMPIRALAEKAEHLLEASKDHKEINQSDRVVSLKNAVSVFGHTVSWSYFQVLLKTGDWLKDLFENGNLTTALGYRMIQYSRYHQRFNATGRYEGERADIKSGLYLSHMKYDFVRNLSDDSKDTKKKTNHLSEKDYQGFMKISSDRKMLTHMEIPLFYSLYQNRTK